MAFHQQSGLLQALAERLGATVFGLVAAEEIQGVLQELRVLAGAIEQCFAFGGIEARESLVDAHRHVGATGQFGQHEGIAPHEGGNVAGVPPALGVDEQVLAAAQAQHRDRHRPAAADAGEDDRELLAGLVELDPRQVQRIGLGGESEAAGRADLQPAMLLAIERHRLFVIDGVGHSWLLWVHAVLMAAAAAVPFAGRCHASTLSMRRPSSSTTSNSQSPQSIRSPVSGRWPETASSRPATVL